MFYKDLCVRVITGPRLGLLRSLIFSVFGCYWRHAILEPTGFCTHYVFINDGISQYIADVLSGFPEGDGFNPADSFHGMVVR